MMSAAPLKGSESSSLILDIVLQCDDFRLSASSSSSSLPKGHKFLSRAIGWGVKVTFEWAKVNYVAG